MRPIPETRIFILIHPHFPSSSHPSRTRHVTDNCCPLIFSLSLHPPPPPKKTIKRSLPLDGQYSYSGSTGRGVTIYTVDSGLRKTHQEFDRWADSRYSRASHGWDFVDDHPNADDCDGHGTHVAGTAVGRTTGVGESINIFPSPPSPRENSNHR